MTPDSNGQFPDFMRLHGTSFHLFVGALVLATDLCFNQPPAEERESESSDLMLALKELEKMQETSQPAATFVESITKLLINHKVWLPSTTVQTGFILNEMDQFGLDQTDTGEFPTSMQFDGLWDTFIEQPFYGNMGM